MQLYPPGPDCMTVPEPALAAKVDFLQQPGNYPERPAAIEVIETHLSWVFLSPRRVYKLKKPLRYDYLDFSTLAARRHNCEEEVRLNRMLAPSVYLGVIPLLQTGDGRLSLTGPGRTVDYLVKMRRLPHELSLESQLARGVVQGAEIDRAAGQLVDFYLRAPTAGFIDLPELYAWLAAAPAELGELLQTPPNAGEPLRHALLQWLEQRQSLLEQRPLREVHGDLRPQHVYLGPTPLFIDRLEFNRDFRLLDPVEELAFLALECERLGGAWVGERFLAVYGQRSGDPPPPNLVAFYKARRALLWALLSARHLARGGPSRWADRARLYLQLGCAALAGSG